MAAQLGKDGFGAVMLAALAGHKALTGRMPPRLRGLPASPTGMLGGFEQSC
jgi:hypothetical protein